MANTVSKAARRASVAAPPRNGGGLMRAVPVAAAPPGQAASVGGLLKRVAATAAVTGPVYSPDGVRSMPIAVRQLPSRPIGTVNLGAVRVVRRSDASLLGEYSTEGTYLGFSLGKTFKNIGKAVSKAATQVGHTVGTVVTSKIGQGVLGGALALTGVGAPVAAGIFAATKGVGTLIKPGGNLKGALTGAAQGAAEGVVSSAAGSVGRSIIGRLTQSASATGTAATQAANATPGISNLPSPANLPVTLTPSTGVSQIATMPAQDGQIPMIGQVAPAAPLVKRTRASAGGYGMQPGVASQVLQAGAQANKAARKNAAQVDKLNSKLDAVQKALAAAQSLGDQTGISQLSQAAQSLQGQLATAQNVAGQGAADLRMLGGAAQGATAGAVSGAGLSGLGDFIAANKPLVYGGGAVAALGLVLAISHGRAGGR